MSLIGKPPILIVWAVYDVKVSRPIAHFPREADAIAYARKRSRTVTWHRFHVERSHVVGGRAV